MLAPSSYPDLFLKKCPIRKARHVVFELKWEKDSLVVGPAERCDSPTVRLTCGHPWARCSDNLLHDYMSVGSLWSLLLRMKASDEWRAVKCQTSEGQSLGWPSVKPIAWVIDSPWQTTRAEMPKWCVGDNWVTVFPINLSPSVICLNTRLFTLSSPQLYLCVCMHAC